MGVSVIFEGGSEPVELTPGQVTEWAVRVRNTGQVVDRIVLDVLGEAAGYAQVSPRQVNLLPGANERVVIRFSPPRVASLAPGEVPFGLRAISAEDPEGSVIEEGLVVVGEFGDLSAELVPRSATGRRSAKFRLVVENRGNRQEPVRIEPLDPDDKLGFKTRPATFVAQPGTATFVRLKTLPRKGFFRGPNRTLPFQASALPEQGDAATTDGAVLQKQLLPEWLLPALGIAAIAAAALFFVWFFALRPAVNSAATAQGIAASAQAKASAAESAASAAQHAASAAGVKSGKLTGLTVKAASPAVLTGATDMITANGTASNGTTSNPDVVWTSSNPAVATVSQTGLVKAITPGTVTITATSFTPGTAPPTASASPTPSIPDATSSGTLPLATTEPSLAAATGTPTPVATPSGVAVVSGSTTVSVVGPVAVTTAALPQAVLGKTYSQSLAGTGGTGNYTWSVDSGTLPPGFTLSPDGMLSGTGAAVSTATFRARLVNSGPPYQSVTRTFSLTIIDAPAVETSSLPGATIATLYDQTLTAVFGTAPYTWALVPGQGTLPDGMSLNQSTGVISGNPSKLGVFTFSVQVTDSASQPQSATQQLSIAVASPLVINTPAALPQEAVKGQPFSLELNATGGIQPYAWSLVSGALPSGLNLDSNGTISGTAGATGTATFTVQATSPGPPVQSITKAVTLTVVSVPAVSTSALNDATTGNTYRQTLTASFGTPPYTWSLVPGQGNLPPGLTLDPDSGLISGTPTMAGSSTFTAEAVDSTVPSQTATQHLSITVASPLGISTLGLPGGVVDSQYSWAMSAAGGSKPYAWSVSSGSLPDGLTLDPVSGLITGIPSSAGMSTFTVQVTDDGKPTRTASRELTLTVVPQLVGSTTSLPAAAVSNAYTAQLTAVGGTPKYVWALTGTLPPGLALSASGQITGTPTTPGDYPFSIQITDASSPPLSVTEDEVINVGGSLQITTTTLADAVVGHAYQETLAASGGKGQYTWGIASGSLPAGLHLDPGSGKITGTVQPNATGATITFSLTATGPPQQKTTKDLTLRVSSPLAFTDQLPAAAVIGQSFDATPKPQGGSGSFQWSEAGPLPDGLTFSSTNGEISGSVASTATTGSYPFKITLTDSDGGLTPVTQQFTLKVVAQLAAGGSINVNANYRSPFHQQITPTGGVGPYSYSLADPHDAPPWLSVNATSGMISGTPDTDCSKATDSTSGQSDTFSCPPATFTVPVSVTDSLGDTFSVTVNLTVSTPPLVVDHDISVSQAAGKSFKLSLGTVHGGYGSGTVSFTATGLPCSADGTTCDQLNFTSGTVTGTLTDFGAGSYNVVVTVTQDDPVAGSANTYVGTYTITINTVSGISSSPAPSASATPSTGATS